MEKLTWVWGHGLVGELRRAESGKHGDRAPRTELVFKNPFLPPIRVFRAVHDKKPHPDALPHSLCPLQERWKRNSL